MGISSVPAAAPLGGFVGSPPRRMSLRHIYPVGLELSRVFLLWYRVPVELPRRMHARYPCRLKARLRAGSSAWPAEIVEISASGAVVRVAADLPGPLMELDVPDEGGTAVIRARIVRRAGHDYAVQFEPHFSEQHKLKRIVDAARRPSGPA